jgi:hypothetical protein
MGAHVYGEYGNSTSDSTFSVEFWPWLTANTEFLLSTGDMSKWLITTKAALDGAYTNGLRNVSKSSDSSVSCMHICSCQLKACFAHLCLVLTLDLASWTNRLNNSTNTTRPDPIVVMYGHSDLCITELGG